MDHKRRFKASDRNTINGIHDDNHVKALTGLPDYHPDNLTSLFLFNYHLRASGL